MSYYNPSFGQSGETSVFSVSKCSIDLGNLTLHENPKTPIALFDFPKDLSVMIDDNYIPGALFDYFSPLLVTEELILSGKIGFYQNGEIQSLKSVECSRLKGEGIESVLKMAMKGVIFYPGSYYINYKNMTVSLTGKSRQLWELFDNMNTLQGVNHPGSSRTPGFPGDGIIVGATRPRPEENEEVSNWIPMDPTQMLSLHQLIQQAFVNNPLLLVEEEEEDEEHGELSGDD